MTVLTLVSQGALHRRIAKALNAAYPDFFLRAASKDHLCGSP